MKPLCIDLFCGLGGWTEGALSEGYECIGFDIERHMYALPELPDSDGSKGTKPVEHRGWTQGCAVSLGLEGASAKPCTRIVQYPAQLVLQDVLTLHGSQFKDAALIVASPPCKAYSYMAMPWGIAKREAEWQRWFRDSGSRFADSFTLNALFDACFRIQREASEAAGRHVPLIVENVKGAQSWVGSAAWHFGSYYLWGDVPALMPWSGQFKGFGGSWFAQNHNADSGSGGNPVDGSGVKQRGSGPAWFDKALDERRKAASGLKAGGDWFGTYAEQKAAGTISPCRLTGNRTTARKAASAQIAKIPFELARWIAYCFKPR